MLHLIRANPLGRYVASAFDLRNPDYRPLVSIVTHGELRVIADRNSWGPKKFAALENALAILVTSDLASADVLEAYLALALRHGARNLRVFGSVARGEATENSDPDLLVEWEPGRGLLDHVALAQDLQDLLGVKVHIGTGDSLHWYVRDDIVRQALPL